MVERILGGVGLPTPIPTQAANPIPPVSGIPGAFSVEETEYAPRSTTNLVRFELHNGREWVEFTHLVNSAEWTIGEQQPNRIGSLMRPSQGVILINDNGEFSLLNTNTTYNPHPGARVRITQGEELLFNGFSAGVQMVETVAGDQYVTAMPIYSSMRRLAEFDEGFFQRLSGTPYIHEALRVIIGNHKENILVDADESDVQIYATRLNRSGALGSNRQRAQFLDAMRILAVLEGGRIYDNRKGAVRFENFARRISYQGETKKITGFHTINTNPQDTLVVNVIEGSSSSVASSSLAPIEFTTPLPITFDVPPNESDFAVELYVKDDGIQFIESWDIADIDYAHDVQIEQYDLFIRIRFNNPTQSVARATINQIRGEAFRLRLAERFYARSEPSITIYGPKAAVFPSEMLVDQNAMRARLNAFLQLFDGMTRDGGVNPLISLSVIIPNPKEIYDISDLVLLDWITPLKQHAREYPFWVDSTKYTYASNRELSVELTLTDALISPITRSEVVLGNVSVFAPQENLVGSVPVSGETLIGHVATEKELGSIPVDVLLGNVSIEQMLGNVEVSATNEYQLGSVTIPPFVVFERDLGNVSIPEFNPVEVTLGNVLIGDSLLLPPSNIRAELVTPNSILWAWDTPEGFYQGFEVEFFQGTTLQSSQVITANSISFQGLEPNSQYTITVRSTAGVARSQAISDVVTTLGFSPPRNFRTFLEDESSITLTWDEPLNAIGTPSYRLQFRVLETVTWRTSGVFSQTNAEVENLTPDTEYEFRVRAEYATGNSEWVVTNGTTDPISTPGIPSNIQQTLGTTQRVRMSWDIVPDATSYEIEFPNSPTSGSMIRIGSNILEAVVPYQATRRVRVRSVRNQQGTVTRSGWSGYVNITMQTLSPVTNLRKTGENLSARTLTMSWDEPTIDAGNDRPTGYAVSYAPTSIPGDITRVIVSTPTITISVEPGSNYAFGVSAVYPRNLRSSEVLGNAEIGEDTPLTVPTGFRVRQGTITFNNMSLAWNSVFNATYEVENVTDDAVYPIVGTAFQIANLMPATQYTFRIRSVRGDQRSEWSSPFIASTNPVPAPVRVYNDVVSREDQIIWNFVAPARLDTFEYRIRLTSDPDQDSSYTSIIRTMNIQITATGLQENSNYTIQVRMVYLNYFSDWVSATALTRPATTNVTVTNLRAIQQTSSTIVFDWETTPNQAISEYQFRELETVVWSNIQMVSGSTVTLENLRTETNYEIRVRGRIGPNTPASEWVVANGATEAVGAIEPPTNVEVRATTARSIRFGWVGSTTAGVTYEYQFRVLETANWSRSQTVGTTTVTLNNLALNTMYEFRVRATKAGASPSIWVVANGQTDSNNQAGAPSNLRAINVSTSGATFAWDAPLSVVDGYEYQIAQGISGVFGGSQTTRMTNVNIMNLMAGQTYRFRVRATKAGLLASGWITINVMLQSPHMIPDDVMTDTDRFNLTRIQCIVDGSSIRVIVGGSVHGVSLERGVDFVDWQWKKPGGSFSPLHTTRDSEMSFIGLLPGTYTFRARGRRGNLAAPFAEESCTIAAPIDIGSARLPPPINVVSIAGPGYAGFEWDAPTLELITSGGIEYTLVSAYDWNARILETPTWNIGGTHGEFTIVVLGNLNSGDIYEFRVRAIYSGSGGSGFSDWVVVSATVQ